MGTYADSEHVDRRKKQSNNSLMFYCPFVVQSAGRACVIENFFFFFATVHIKDKAVLVYSLYWLHQVSNHPHVYFLLHM